MYLYGNGVHEDCDKAVMLCKQAAEIGNIDALNTLARFYLYGWPIKQDRLKAVELYKKAIIPILDTQTM